MTRRRGYTREPARETLTAAAPQSAEILEALKHGAAALRDAGIEFALGGGLSAWARGGPPTEHDIDFLIRERDIDAALHALAAAGMRAERPPEGWLAKAWYGDVLIDLLFAPYGAAIDDKFFARCDQMSVAAVRMLVMPIDDLVVGKLLALTEHNLDYSSLLVYARALREQIDWDAVSARTASSPFARTFLRLLHELDIVPEASESRRSTPAAVRSWERWVR